MQKKITAKHPSSFTKNLSSLRIADLELFISAGHLHNLGKAALLHHLSQSAASAAIQRVEDAIGLPLCTHERRQFQLTTEGYSLLPLAESWIESLHHALLASHSQPIRLATTHAIARASVTEILPYERIDLKIMRPDNAYGAVIRGEADIALVIDNAAWEGVETAEVGKGFFQLYSSVKNCPHGPVLLPEDQIEVLALQQRWLKMTSSSLSIKARIPSWSLIADICSRSEEIGFLPEFLAHRHNLHPLPHQPEPYSYRILALYRPVSTFFQDRINFLIDHWKKAFSLSAE